MQSLSMRQTFHFHKYVKGFGKGRIDNYYVEGEILESSIGTAIIGNTHWLPTQYAPSFKWYDNAWTRTAKRIKAAVAKSFDVCGKRCFIGGNL